jgi:ketosteroid isomerase-like protein
MTSSRSFILQTPPNPVFVYFMKLFLTFLLAVAAGAPTPDVLQTLVDSERAFAQTSVEHGIRNSFLQFFADDGVIFTPGPTNGKKFYANYDNKGRQLNWRPIFATVASAGDLGLSTGPWEMKKSPTDAKPFAFGDFVSIWKKQPDNSWKVMVDLGIDHPAPSEPPGDVQLFRPSDQPGVLDLDLVRRDLEKAEKALAQALAKDAGAAMAAFAADNVRLYRENAFPAVGKTVAGRMLASDHGKMTRQTSGAGMSASGDLAYRYGSYASERADGNEQGYFLSVWILDSHRGWQIIADVQKREEKK